MEVYSTGERMNFQLGDLFVYTGKNSGYKGEDNRLSLYITSIPNNYSLCLAWYDKTRQAFINNTSYSTQDVWTYIQSGDWEYYPIIK